MVRLVEVVQTMHKRLATLLVEVDADLRRPGAGHSPDPTFRNCQHGLCESARSRRDFRGTPEACARWNCMHFRKGTKAATHHLRPFQACGGRLGASLNQMPSIRPAAKPRVDVRPGALVRAAPGHNTDVPSGDTEQFLVAAPNFGKHRLRLAGRSDVIALGDDCQQIRTEPA
jgi:hypothetical protein